MKFLQCPVLLILACVTLFVQTGPIVRGQEALTARQILQQVGATYAAARSYSDTGAVRTVFVNPRNHVVQKQFSTAFVRPDQFRFELSRAFEAHSMNGAAARFIIWRGGKDVKMWSNVKPGAPQQAVDLLRNATGAFAGVTTHTSYITASLLFPGEVQGPAPTRLTAAERIEDARLDDNTDCFRLQGRWPSDGPATLWIEKQTFLVRRIDFAHDSVPRSKTTITYTPVLNGAVNQKMLEFNPPTRK